MILHIHADYNKRLGAYKIAYVLRRDYGINISVGRVYRLMKQLQLPKMSTDKPSVSSKHDDHGACFNHLHQNFHQKAPNLVWVSDITYLKAGGKWYYLCIVMDLFSRKVISWHISANADAKLVITAFRKAYEKRNAPYGLMFHSDEIVEQKLRLYNKLFTPTTISYKNGTALAFVMELRYLSVDKPAGYNADTAAQELAALEEESMSEPAMAGAGSDEGEFPNIIVIMDEAFSDPAILGNFTVNQDYMPFVHSLLDGAENTVSGWLNVSVLGGNTANTEFEYLTGNTMAFLPQGSIPYQQYIKGEAPSLASHLAGLGYQTVAMHPYNASGWDRDTVYPAMGFSEMYFLPDFDNAAKVRNYVSDQSDFEKIVEIYENKGDNPLFLFNVTMQNHSSYTESFDNFDPQIEVEGGSQTLNNYLSLLSLSDAALSELISYFEEQEEDTIIVFFGDHQTTNSVIEPILKQNGKSSSTLTEEEQADRYKVPFFIWANFDIEEETGVETSVNYLGAKTLLAAGVPMDGYFTYLSVFSETVPWLTVPLPTPTISPNCFPTIRAISITDFLIIPLTDNRAQRMADAVLL